MKKMHVLGLMPAAVFALASSAYAQFGTGPNEVESNDTKALADTNQGTWPLPAMNAAGVMIGNSTSTTGAGIDTFRLRTASQAFGIYRHRFIITTQGTAGHTGSIRGLNQVGPAGPAAWDGMSVGTPGTTDTAIQTSVTTTSPARMNQFYSFHRPAELYYRVTGGSLTTANYVVNYEVEQVTPITGPTILTPGEIRITTRAQGHSTDTDFWVYDSNFNAILGYGNDDTSLFSEVPAPPSTALQSTLVRNYAAGVYYLAISNFNVSNNMGSPIDDNFRTGGMMDFSDVVVNSSATTNLNVSVNIGGTLVNLTKTEAFQVLFVRFEVLPTPGASALFGLAGVALLRRRRA